MEIRFEMIDEVMEATQADYPTVKEALIAAEGDVAAAIEAIKAAKTEAPETEILRAIPEEEIPESEDTVKEEIPEGDSKEDWTVDEFAQNMIDRLKKRVQEGNVDRIKISRDGKTILNLPLSIGILGGLISIAAIPWAVILGVLTAYGLNCKIEIITKDGNSEEM